MNRYPTSLSFDRSKSAMVRLKGRKLAEVTIHWAKDYDIPQILSACPDSIGLDGPSCKLCNSTPSLPIKLQRLVSTGWDIKRGRWCIFMAPKSVFGEIRSKIPNDGIDDFLEGKGPDIIIQRGPAGTEIEVVLESIGRDPTLGEMPPIEDYLLGLQSRSHWARTANIPRVGV